MTNHKVDPHLFVVFGATSDLMRRKLLPALYRFSEQYGTEKLLLVGLSRQRDLDDAGFRALAREALAAAGCRKMDRPTPGATPAYFSQSLGEARPKITRPWRPASRRWKKPVISRKPPLLSGPAPRRLRTGDHRPGPG